MGLNYYSFCVAVSTPVFDLQGENIKTAVAKGVCSGVDERQACYRLTDWLQDNRWKPDEEIAFEKIDLARNLVNDDVMTLVKRAAKEKLVCTFTALS